MPEQTEETWKTIERFSDYEVSNKGRMRNSKTLGLLKIETLSYYSHPHNYYCFNLENYPEKYVELRVDYCVLIAFLGREEGRDSVIHLDGNRINDNLENLKWGTTKELKSWYCKIGAWGGFTGETRKINPSTVKQIWELYYSQKMKRSEIAKIYEVKTENITDIVFGKKWKNITEKLQRKRM